MTKQEVRAAMYAKRKAVSNEERLTQARRIAGLASLCVQPGARVAVYIANDEEIPILFEEFEGVELYAPKWNAVEERYELAPLGGELVAGPHGIMEPMSTEFLEDWETVDVWLVPGLAFAHDGRRIGYGGGWYDRFLAHKRDDARSYGVAYPWQLCDDFESDEYDIAVDEVLY